MTDAIVVLNAGSSSLKFSVFERAQPEMRLIVRGQLDSLGSTPRLIARDASDAVVAERVWRQQIDHRDALESVLSFLRARYSDYRVCGVGHRVVHGGLEYSQPVRLDAAVLARLESYIPLAPLHQPHNLAPIRVLLDRSPEVLQVACFDTAFHRKAPWLAQTFALPAELTEQGIRRYGFHGLSYEYLMSELPKLDARVAAGRLILMHLGNGSSMCAVRGGQSVATTMGFTTADGLPMGTRCGSLDPGVILYCMDELKMGPRDIERLIYHESGLLGVSGISSDMRALEENGSPDARAAIDLYCYRIGRALGSLAAALGGLDAIVFTAGIGENSTLVRQRVCRDAYWLGVQLDGAANASGGPRISKPTSHVSAWRVPTNEELMVAKHTSRLLGAGR